MTHEVVDQDVIAAAQRGDHDAVVQLWRTYQPQILRFLRSINADAPEDVASQVWIDVARMIERFVGDGVAFQRWIFTIAKHRSIDEVRRSARRREVVEHDRTESSDGGGGLDVPGDVGSLEHALQIVRRLPPDMAEAVMLRVIYDLPVGDVAEIMGCSEGNVRVLVHRGLHKLGDMLGRLAMAAP